MIAEMPGHVLGKWMQFMEMTGFGPLHTDTQFGILASIVANLFRGRNDRTAGPADFFPALKAAEVKQAEQDRAKQQYLRGIAWAGIFGAQADRARKLEERRLGNGR